METKAPRAKDDICPVCGKPAKMWCKCWRNERFCEDKHKWWWPPNADKPEVLYGEWEHG